ncbi:MAG: DNA damage-inducible protein D [Tumebacillaceae bacterium]
MNHSTQSNEHSAFEQVRRFDQHENEYWSARDLQKILEYTSYKKFQRAIEKAIVSCEQSGQDIDDHFAQTDQMVEIGSNAKRRIKDFHLSRYACYLVIQNADPSKPMVAFGQTYFAVQTRKQELFEQASEDERRLLLREELKKHNSALADAAYDAGVLSHYDFAIFQNHGYRGLYGGLDTQDIHRRKGLKKSHKILDHMGSTELAANLFRATQTEEKLRREQVQGKTNANHVHYEVGQKVRQTIADLGGTMPENLPTPKESIQQIERKMKRNQQLNTPEK